MTLAARDGKAVRYHMAKPVIEHRDVISGFGGDVKEIFALLGCYIS